jgi:hypothetical protein
LGSRPALGEFRDTSQSRTITSAEAIEATRAPKNPRRVTSELGNVSPTIVVPGPWSAADVQFQAEVRRAVPLSLKLTRLGGAPMLDGLVRALRGLVV